MRGLIDIEQKQYELIGCCTYYVAFSYDLDLVFSRSDFENAVSQEWEGPLIWNERDVSRQNVTLTLWLQTLTSPITLTLDFQGQILKLLYFRNGKVDSLGMKGMWVGYDVGCTMVLILGRGARQINRPSTCNGSMWIVKLLQFPACCPVNGLFVHWSRAEGRCRSLNALSILFSIIIFSPRFLLVGLLLQYVTLFQSREPVKYQRICKLMMSCHLQW